MYKIKSMTKNSQNPKTNENVKGIEKTLGVESNEYVSRKGHQIVTSIQEKAK